MPLAGVRLRLAHGQDRPAAERGRRVGGIGERERAVAEPRAGSDDPRPDGADDGLVALRPRPGERRRGGHELGVAVEAGRDGARGSDQTALPKRPHRVRKRHGQRAARHLDVRDPRAGEAGAHRRHLAVQGAKDDWEPFERVGQLVRLLLAPDALLGRAYTAAPSRARPPPPRSPSPRVRFA